MVTQPRSAVVTALAELRDVSGYFALGTGVLNDGWRPVGHLYNDTALLSEIVGRVKARIDVTEQRVAASTFYLGFAARLWSIGLGMVAGYRMLVDLAPEQLLFQETDGQIALHLEHPVGAAARRSSRRVGRHGARHTSRAAGRSVAPARPDIGRVAAGQCGLGPARCRAGLRSRPRDDVRMGTGSTDVRRSTITRSSRIHRNRLPPHQLLLVLPNAERRPLRRLRPDPGAGKGTR